MAYGKLIRELTKFIIFMGYKKMSIVVVKKKKYEDLS
jgi:hypothetical protein